MPLTAKFPTIKFRLNEMMNLKPGDVIPISNPKFVEIYCNNNVSSLDKAPMLILVLVFLTGELKAAFQIGFLLFLIIDLVVASVLMSMDMMMLSPLVISLPFKIWLSPRCWNSSYEFWNLTIAAISSICRLCCTNLSNSVD